MNKKTLFAYIVLIGCIILLVGSYMQWKGKITSVGGQSPIPISSTPAGEDDESKEKDVESVNSEQDIERLLALTANADEQVQEVFKSRLESGEQVDFLITGSTAIDNGNPGYAERLQTALEESYGDLINVAIATIDGTSEDFISEQMEEEIDLSKGYDIVLFEPFTLNNNGIVTIEDEHAHINQFRELLNEQVEDAVVVLQPSYPIYAATYYPTQVEALQAFASSEGIPFVNHWDSWPDFDSEELLNYLEDKKVPNSDGAEVWANALIDYFIKK